MTPLESSLKAVADLLALLIVVAWTLPFIWTGDCLMLMAPFAAAWSLWLAYPWRLEGN